MSTVNLSQSLAITISFSICFEQVAVSRADESHWQQERIKVLVEMLASKNADPGPGPSFRGSDRYNKEAQATVYLAIEQLKAEGSAAFDLLVQHADDDRYSYSYEAASGTFRISMGKVCRQIVRDGIYGYREQLKTMTGEDFVDHMKGQSLQDWWRKNRGRTLWEIQLDAIDDAIRFVETVDRTSSQPIREGGARGTASREYRLEADEFEARRNQNLKTLRALRAYIATCKRHYVEKAPGDHPGVPSTMYKLPWPTPGPK